MLIHKIQRIIDITQTTTNDLTIGLKHQRVIYNDGRIDPQAQIQSIELDVWGDPIGKSKSGTADVAVRYDHNRQAWTERP